MNDTAKTASADSDAKARREAAESRGGAKEIASRIPPVDYDTLLRRHRGLVATYGEEMVGSLTYAGLQRCRRSHIREHAERIVYGQSDSENLGGLLAAVLAAADILIPAPSIDLLVNEDEVIAKTVSRLESAAAEREASLALGGFGAFDPADTFAAKDGAEHDSATSLIDGILSTNELSALTGRSYVGKSYLALDWAFCVAAGIDWHGRWVRKSRVLYLRMEGANDFQDRLDALSSHYGRPIPDGLLIYPRVVTFLDPRSAEAVARHARAENVGLVITDTVNKAFGGGNENEPAAMGQFIQSAEMIREATRDATHLLIHHPNNADELSMRGHSSLFSAIDRQYAITAPHGAKHPDRVLHTVKNKPGQADDGMVLRFETVGRSAVLVSGRSGSASDSKVLAAVAALGSPCSRTALRDLLIARGDYSSKGSANSAIRATVATGALSEDGDALYPAH